MQRGAGAGVSLKYIRYCNTGYSALLLQESLSRRLPPGLESHQQSQKRIKQISIKRSFLTITAN